MSTKIINFKDIQKEKEENEKQIVYIHKECGMFDGLYYKDNDPDVAYRIKISFWGVDKRGDIFALVPFMKDVYILEDMDDSEKMHFAGYYDTTNDSILEKVPEFRIQEIKYGHANLSNDLKDETVQTIQDYSGAHGVFVNVNSEELSIVPIHSWRLYNDGTLEPFIVKEDATHLSPIILTGLDEEDDKYIESMFVLPDFSYYFNYETAQKVKESILSGGEIHLSEDFFNNIK